MQKTIDKGFYRSVLALAVPIALQNLINVGVQSADVIMLGIVGEVVLSASSAAGQVQFVMTLLFFGLASGATVLAAQYWGKGDIRSIEKVLSISLRISVAVSFLFFLAAQLFPAALMRIFTTEEALIAEGIKYLRIVSFSYLCMGFTNIYLIVLRSVEKVVITTVVYFISLVANVILNAVLIFGLLGFPAMGIEGAALATTLARAIELVIVIFYAGRNTVLRLRWKDYVSGHKALFKDYMRYALPTILNELLWGMAISAYTIIVGHLATSVPALAAYSVTSVVRQLAMVVSIGIANASAVLIGKTIGAGKWKDANLYAGRLVRLSVISGAVGALLILIIRPLVVAGMSLSPQATEYLSFLLLLICPYILVGAFNVNIVVGILRGGGDTRFGLLIDTGTMWIICIPLALLAAFVFHASTEVVFLMLFCDEFFKLPLSIYRYRSKAWLRNVTREES